MGSGQVRRSPAVRRLFAARTLRRPAGVSRRDLADFLYWLLVPADLRGLRYAAGQFLILAGQVAWLDDLEPADLEAVRRLSAVSTWLSSLEPADFAGEDVAAFHIEPGPDPRREGRIQNPLSRKGLTRHPAYALLFHVSEPGTSMEWQAMAMAFVLAAVRVVRTYVSRRGYARHEGDKRLMKSPQDAYPASQALRVMNRWPADQFVVLGAPPAALVPLVEPASLKGRAFSQHRKWRYFIERAYEKRKWGATRQPAAVLWARKADRLREGHVELPYDRIATITVAPDPDPETRPPIERIHRRLIAEEEVEPDLDTVPHEVHDPATLDLIENDCADTRRSAASVALAAIGRQQQTVMLAQDFGWRFDDLTEHEAVVLHGRLYRALGEELNRPHPDHGAIAELLTLLIMLWTGADALSASELKVVRPSVGAPTSQLCIRAMDEPTAVQRYEWRREALMPEYSGNSDLSDKSSRKRKATVWLPDLGQVGMLVKRCLDLEWPYRRSPSVMRWSVESNKRAPLLAKRLQQIAGIEASRWTLAKLERFTLSRLMAVSGDITSASLIRGRIEHRANARLFYCLINLSHLRRIYVSAMGRVAVSVGADPRWVTEVAAITTHDWAVGARHSLTTTAFRDGVSAVIGGLDHLSRFETFEGFVKYHNLYTAYVIWMLGTACALRATKNALIDPAQVDPVMGISAFRDKDTLRPYHARLVWVPELVRDQLIHYRDHRRRVDAELMTRGLVVPQKVGYYLSKSCRVTDLRPKKFVEELKPYLPMPANAHRRYMRTTLIERGCAVETVDAMLGHWAIGEEPWAKESSFDWAAHLAELRKHVPPILDELGWEVLRSPLTGDRPTS